MLTHLLRVPQAFHSVFEVDTCSLANDHVDGTRLDQVEDKKKEALLRLAVAELLLCSSTNGTVWGDGGREGGGNELQGLWGGLHRFWDPVCEEREKVWKRLKVGTLDQPTGRE